VADMRHVRRCNSHGCTCQPRPSLPRHICKLPSSDCRPHGLLCPNHNPTGLPVGSSWVRAAVHPGSDASNPICEPGRELLRPRVYTTGPRIERQSLDSGRHCLRAWGARDCTGDFLWGARTEASKAPCQSGIRSCPNQSACFGRPKSRYPACGQIRAQCPDMKMPSRNATH